MDWAGNGGHMALKEGNFNSIPTGLACFFTFMTVAEGGGRRAVVRKFQDVYIPALKANFIVWPAVQMLNFRVMPIQFQIVSVHPYLRARHARFGNGTADLWNSRL